jgi:hypothetical protein
MTMPTGKPPCSDLTLYYPTMPQWASRVHPPNLPKLSVSNLPGNFSYESIRVIDTVPKQISKLVPTIFLKLVSNMEKTTLLKEQINAKLKATLKKSKTINMSKEIQDSLAKENTVEPESMKTLM